MFGIQLLLEITFSGAIHLVLCDSGVEFELLIESHHVVVWLFPSENGQQLELDAKV